MMSAKNHNKKRNVALLYEFLVRYISTCMVERDDKKSAAALRILKKHFKPGTELYREFRLFNSLIKSTVSSEAVPSILIEAKSAARDYDLKKLDREKSLLIRNINHQLNDPMFYDQTVPEYKMYATIQTLLNDWRQGTKADLQRLATYETQLASWLMTEKKSAADDNSDAESAGMNRLVLKMMTKKFNEKYSGTLNNEQKKLIREFVFSIQEGSNQANLKNYLVELRDGLVKAIDTYVEAHPEHGYINEKLVTTRTELLAENVENVDDGVITKFLLYSKLNSELHSEDE